MNFRCFLEFRLMSYYSGNGKTRETLGARVYNKKNCSPEKFVATSLVCNNYYGGQLHFFYDCSFTAKAHLSFAFDPP